MDLHRAETPSFFPNCREFAIYGGTFNHIVGHPAVHGRERDHSGLRIVRQDEILGLNQIIQRSTYSLHSAETSDNAVLVKVFHGPLAKQTWEETSATSRLMMHPNLLRLLGRSADESPTPFLVYNGVQETVQNRLVSALRGDLQQCLSVGVAVVHGLSLGLSYLELQQLPPGSCTTEAFDILIGPDDNIILSYNSGPKTLKRKTQPIETDWFDMFNIMCRTAFNDANHIIYQEMMQRNVPISTPESVSSLVHSRVNPELPSTSAPSHQPPLREFIWIPSSSTYSLSEIAHQTQSFRSHLRSLSSSSTEPPIPLYRSTETSDNAHRGIGYLREEIFISAQICNSYIVHSEAETQGSSSVANAFPAVWNPEAPVPRSLEQSSERAIQACVQRIQIISSHDDATDTRIAHILREYQAQKEERRVKEAQIGNEIELLLQEALMLPPMLQMLLADLMGHLRISLPRYKTVPLVSMAGSRKPHTLASENEAPPPDTPSRSNTVAAIPAAVIPAHKPTPRPGQRFRQRTQYLQPKEDEDEPAFPGPLDNRFLGDAVHIFEKPKGFDLNPVGPIWDAEIDYYDPVACSKAPAWFDMAY
ncbi:hypothetical protein C8R47DRAFT_1167631 [Mycena vitilis]|nr:hypothetical protein C8R47DRAFT_1167620 [Mycena vitilis]KAJ6453878.1 hypothetical protein C8R47DRAFT_1167631 [Mycena vitilis]